MAIKNTNFSFEKIDDLFKNSKKIFFVGIGGISLSTIATFCLQCGKEIYGYDQKRSKESAKLEAHAKIKYYSTPDSVYGMDLVIYSNAIGEDNFEYQGAKKLQIPTLSRANFLGYVASRCKNSIVISGTHGKSTTTSFLARILDYAGYSPSVFCGAKMKDYDSAYLKGSGECGVFEGCEYMDSFLSFEPSICGILNIEYDHPDYFESYEDVLSSFTKFISQSKKAVVNIDDKGVNSILSLIGKNRIVTFSLRDKGADYYASLKNDGFVCYHDKKKVLEAPLNLRGEHFALDAICASVIALELGASPIAISYALSEATGVKRRLEFIKKLDTGLSVFEDYAHHPTEILATYNSLKEMGFKKILCAFQAHTFSRTHYLYDGFLSSLSKFDELIILPTFCARENNEFGVSESELARALGGTFVDTLEKMVSLVKESKCDCGVIMGAGDITEFKCFL